MTNTVDAMKLALEALEAFEIAGLATFKTIDAITALRVAIASYSQAIDAATQLKESSDYVLREQAQVRSTDEQAQPVITVRVWRDENHDQTAEFEGWHKLPDGEHVLYTTPPPRQPLTDEEIDAAMPSGIYDCLADPWDCNVGDGDVMRSIKKDVLRIARAIEAAHGITKENT